MEKLIDFDPSFRHPFTCMVAGPSKCGKTHLIIDLINANIINPQPERVIWCFGYYQEAFRRLYNFEFVQGLPKNDPLDGRPTLVVIDDLMLETAWLRCLRNARITRMPASFTLHKIRSINTNKIVIPV